jgi:hypothetical protein
MRNLSWTRATISLRLWSRLPAVVHRGLTAHRLLLPARSLLAGDRGVSRFSRMKFLCMHGVFDSAGPRRARVIAPTHCCLPVRLTPSAPRNTGFRSSIPSLQIPLSNASSATLPPPSHGSGPGWFATPSPYDSFIRYSMPVLSRRYPDGETVCPTWVSDLDAQST